MAIHIGLQQLKTAMVHEICKMHCIVGIANHCRLGNRFGVLMFVVVKVKMCRFQICVVQDEVRYKSIAGFRT